MNRRILTLWTVPTVGFVLFGVATLADRVNGIVAGVILGVTLSGSVTAARLVRRRLGTAAGWASGGFVWAAVLGPAAWFTAPSSERGSAFAAGVFSGLLVVLIAAAVVVPARVAGRVTGALWRRFAPRSWQRRHPRRACRDTGPETLSARRSGNPARRAAARKGVADRR